MEKFTRISSVVAPMDRANIDTDAIIPKQFLISIKRTGFGPNLFDEWRYLDIGQPDSDNSHRPLNKDFVLNQPEYADSKILLARENFGCGSSREHAPWALKDYGFEVVIAPSFADIFFNNCFKNGILPIVLSESNINGLFASTENIKGYSVMVDLEKQVITTQGGGKLAFEVDQFRKHCLLNGLDDIGLTLKHEAEIKAFEKKYQAKNPWLFG